MFFISILRDDIFRTLERIQSNQPFYTSLDLTYDVYMFPISGWFIIQSGFSHVFGVYSEPIEIVWR